MSLIKRGLEKRDYLGGFFSNPYGLPADFIPTNGMAGVLSSGGVYPISSEAAMRHYTVFACVRIIADLVSALPLDAHGLDGTPIDPMPSKLVTPSAYTTRLGWLWQVMSSLLLRGNAYGMISAYDRLAYPAQVDLISPDNVRVDKDTETGKKIFIIGGKTLTTDQIWHLPGPQLPGELEGMSPIRYASRTIGLGLEAEKFGADYMANGIHPTATVESDQQINGDQARDIKQRIKTAQVNRDLVVLGAGMHMNAWQISADESQFLETMRFNAVAVAQIFGVPPEMLGAAARGSSVTYANREERAQDFLNIAINPWLARLEEALSAWFPRTTYVKFNTGALLRSDLMNRYNAYQIGIRNNFVLPSEARALEDFEPIPGIDNKPLPTSPSGSGEGPPQPSQGGNGQPPPTK